MLLALVVVLVGAVTWWKLTLPPNPAAEHLDQLRVQGYSRSDESVDDRVGPAASAVFFGPPVDDVLQVVSAPGLRLQRYEPDESVKQKIQQNGPGPLEDVAKGDFGDDCHLWIDRLHYERDSWMSRTPEQVDAMYKGSLFVFEFIVTCGPG
ncbi:hypothetical protein [Nocardia nepalensis]|uniref:hypothetical protein n=1 Tax=Nocardia nepalensis TaxID=3375448 RepID=UPI003B66DD31